MSDKSDRDMERADIANGEGDPEDTRGRPDVPPDQDPDAGYPTSTGVVDDDEGALPPLGEELEAD